ncbi:hypothetical protein [Microbacterium sp. KHB019]|uniref:hypothetical protein n=1 Tax=Microbacterium sp. KHB019 TaxID=3129770 RepID=UPI00307AD6CC
MPLPLVIPIIAVAAAALAGTAIFAAIPKIWKILDKNTVAILGAPQTGKTALIRLLRDVDAPDDGLPSAVSGEDRGRFRLEVKDKAVDFAVPRDLPGSDGLNVAEWKDAFDDADHVWYLFRADLVAQDDAATVQLLRTHFALLRKWLSAKPGSGPKILLVGTWADEHSDYARHASRVAEKVMKAGVIKIGSVQLGGSPVVVGSLATSRDADRLLKGIKSRLQ